MEKLGLPYGSAMPLHPALPAERGDSRRLARHRAWAQHADLAGPYGLSIGGKTYRRVNEQARRISACTLMFYSDRKGSELMRRGGFVDGAITMTDAFGDQPGLWQERVLLNEEFYGPSATTRFHCPRAH